MLSPKQHHDFNCPSCKRSYRIARELVPEKGARVRCKQCSQSFVVRPPKESAGIVWVLTGDPAISNEEVQEALKDIRYVCSIEVLDGAARAERLKLLLQEKATAPGVIIFGDMHVLLQDELLRLVCDEPDVERLRISTHDNADLTEAASDFCGFDHQISLPTGRWDVSRILQRVVDKQKNTTHLSA